MRKIKFRGKRIIDGEWIYGDLIHYESGERTILSSFSKYGYEATEIYRKDKVIPKTIGQFTGLYDKNGKEIYEGDIVELTNARGFKSLAEVIFIDGCFEVKFQRALNVFEGPFYKYTRYRDYLKVYVANSAIKVIGSIYTD